MVSSMVHKMFQISLKNAQTENPLQNNYMQNILPLFITVTIYSGSFAVVDPGDLQAWAPLTPGFEAQN